MSCGVYHIVSKSTGRRYVGSSKHIEGRWYAHRSSLRAGGHHSKHLQRVFNKYGEDDLYWLIWETCSAEERVMREDISLQALVKLKLEMNGSKTAKSGGNATGLKRSAETRLKMSLSQKGKPRTQKQHVWTDEERQTLSDLMKERHRLGLVETGYNQHKKKQK